MTDQKCTWIITPDDCDPLHTTGRQPPPPPTPAPAPAAETVPPSIDTHPVKPPIHQLDSVNLPVDEHTGFAAAGHVLETATVCGLVVVAMLVLIVAVAARWPLAPHRLRNFAIASLLLPGCSALAGGSWSTPASLLWSGASRVTGGDWAGVRMMLALGVPFAALTATYVWARFVHKTHTVGLKSLTRTERVKEAMLSRKFARAAAAAKLGAPYSIGDGIVLGPLADRTSAKPAGLWAELTARHQQWMVIPHKQAKRHVAVIGATGSGKTEAIKRYAAGMLDYEWRAWQRWCEVPAMRGKHRRPLIVLISCKGGRDDRDLGIEWRANLIRQGIAPQRIAMVMPGADQLRLFETLNAREQRAVLADLLNAGEATTSEGQHFDEMRRRIVSLVVDAPAGPPRSHEEFLDRLDADVLIDLWGGAPDVKRMVTAMQEEKVPQIDDVLIKAHNLFDLLTDHNGRFVFDGGKDLDELDALFVTVPGLDKDAARAQVAAILRMVMLRAGRTAKDKRRTVTLIIDELSALTTSKGAIGLIDVCERGRSQGVAMLIAAQSQEGLAPDAWSLNRLLKSCAGGVLIGYSENAGDLCKHLGSRRAMLPSRHLIKGQRHGDEGQVQVGEAWLVDPDILRDLDTGEFVYARARRAQWGRVIPVTTADLPRLPGTEPGPGPAATGITAAA
ncbi:type IV secretion system DNA-binding domain-containing protein [Nocardia arthritidis]|uniref:Type IV secretion system DNA-binding domain-containing protein n=1 Tax=Nocardia arthritidis TaxID=228602 RepID=A0A6G9YKG9_9NOCA|nr:type IV secretion system DNA-binding domain-containing protein [Nocardia arthritidis]QIS13650.1 type IV secretion system DNA-binding domain-containing protein [Nocardia arthritidis]